jgi:hypothetical protein
MATDTMTFKKYRGAVSAWGAATNRMNGKRYVGVSAKRLRWRRAHLIAHGSRE